MTPLSAISSACSALRVPSWTSRPPRARSTATAVPQLPAPITAALRSGGRPPSHSHCSSITGQIRAPTELASVGEGLSVRGKVRARPGPELDLAGADQHPLAHLVRAEDGHGQHRRAGLQRQAAEAALGAPERAGPDPRSLGEDADRAAALQHRARGDQGLARRTAPAHRDRRRGGSAASPASAARTARPWRRSGAGAATAGTPRSRRGRGSCGGWRRRSAGP